MTDAATPAPDLFDESGPLRPERRARAISPLQHSLLADEGNSGVPLRWRHALAAGAIAIGVGLVSNFPNWAVAVLGVAGAAMYLRALPALAKRIWLVAVASFFFAQCTTIFINIPFNWPMRFGFCAVLVTAWTLVRINGGE